MEIQSNVACAAWDGSSMHIADHEQPLSSIVCTKVWNVKYKELGKQGRPIKYGASLVTM